MLIISSLCSIFIFITATMLCLCWRKKTEKNDLLGLDGLVTQMNPDENVNHLPGTITSFDPVDAANATCDAVAVAVVNDAKRSTTLNNSRRSLPDIPLDGLLSADETVNYERNGDNSSDLYATVEPYTSAKRHTLPNGINSQPSISQHSSISQADDSLSPYARVKEHPYAKLKKTEHPYAYVNTSSSSRSQEENVESSTVSNGIRCERLSTSQTLSEPVVPSRSPRTSEQIGIDIPAASAVAGGIAASQELPYMTPPIAQPNFSGDSQDSSKGYTSISVREPLANIRAQTKGLNKGQAADLDPHYSTVSDDSDDVYTTIQDPNVIYTSESETYAQIQPHRLNVPVEESSNVAEVSQRERASDVTERLGQFDSAVRLPIAECLKNDVNTHSRQASSSSSTANLGSPKPEKRQANSPLPPPPPLPSGPDASNEKPASCKTLDDMYAKVQKSKKRNDKEEDSSNNVVDLKDSERLIQASTSELKKEEKQQNNDTGLTNADSDLYTEHDYETLRKSSNPRYEKLKPKDAERTVEPGYDVINGPASILSSDPGYEALKRGNEASSDEDPNYEELRHRVPSISDSAGYTRIGTKVTADSNLEIDGYSVVQKQSEEVKAKSLSNYESGDEPNYESMPNELLANHNYSILNSGGTESDPNYESVCSNDPNYESVTFLDESVGEPPYERLEDDDSIKTDSQQSSTDKIQSLPCACKNSLKRCTDGQCLNHSDYPNKKEIPDSNSNVSVQFESDFDGIVQV